MKKKILLLILLNIFIFHSLIFSQKSWDGGAGTSNWNDAANWSPDGTPLVSEDVTIGSGYNINIDADATCASLTLSNNNTNTRIFLSSGIQLSISGDLVFGTPDSDNVSQKINIGDGNLSCSGITMPNTGSDTRKDSLILNNGTVNISGAFIMSGNGARNYMVVTGDGIINISGDFYGGTFYRGGSTVNYNGTGDQVIANYNYNNLGVSNGGIKSLRNTTLIYDTLLLDNVIELNSNLLRITNSGTITVTGGYDASKMIDFKNGGTFRRDGNNAALYQMIYPLGVGSEYSPLEITSLSGTIGSGYIQISLSDNNHPLTSGTDNEITKYWDIATSNITITDIQGSLTYNDSDVAVPINESNLTMVGRLFGSSWQTNETGTGYDHSTNQIVLNGAAPSLDGAWTLGESSACFDGSIPDKFTVNNGNWNSTSTWNNGTLPSSTDDVAILHTVTLNTGATVNSLKITKAASLNLYNQDITVTTTTEIYGNLIDNNNSGTNTFTGNLIVFPEGSFTTNNISPFIFEGGITNNGTFAITNGSTTISFNTNSQVIEGDSSIILNGVITIASGISITNQNTENTDGLLINGIINGADLTSQFINEGFLTIGNASGPMSTTGVFDASATGNTVTYNRNGDQTITSATYYDLVLDGTNTKSLQNDIDVNNNLTVNSTLYLGTVASNINVTGNVSIDGILSFYRYQDQTLSISGDLAGTGELRPDGRNNTHSINLGGENNTISTYTNYGDNTSIIYNRIGDQQIFSSLNYRRLVSAGSGNKTLNGDISVASVVSIDGGTLQLNSNTLITSDSVNIAAGAGIEINDNASLLIANNNIITNNGTFSIVGSEGNPAIVSINGSGTYYYNQTGATAEINAQYYQFDNLNNGLNISGGSINSTNNLSNGSFSNGTGNQSINITGIDLSGLSSVSDIVFNAGPTYNVSRTSGTGTINFEDASGDLSGEHYDEDNGNPGSLINWTYPGSTYYSTGNVSAGLTTSWTSNPDGTGANPASVTDGLATLIVQDGHTVTVDNNGDIDVLNLQIGEGTTGIFRIGTDATQRTATIREKLEVKDGAIINAGSPGSPAHELILYGNVKNEGTINLKTTSSNVVNTEVYGEMVFNGTTSPTFNDITFNNGCFATANVSLDINGNVFIEDNATFNDGGLSHTVAGNWSVTGNGNYDATGTIVFDGLVNTINDNPSASSVSFNNITFMGGGVGSIQENTTVNGDILVTNSTVASIANYTITVLGNLTIDPNSTYSQTANTTDFASTTAQSLNLTGNASFYNLSFNNGGVTAKTINGDFTATGRVNIYNGSTVEGSGDYTISGGLRIDGTCNFSGSVTLLGNYLTTYDAGNTLTLGSAELIIDGYVSLGYSSPATALTANVNNNVTIKNGYLIVNNNTQLIGQPGNTFKIDASKSLYVRGTDNFPTGFGTYEIDPAAWIRYDASFDQVVRGNLTYGHIEIDGNARKTVDGPLDIDGNIDLNLSSIFDLQNFSHTFSGTYLFNSTNSSIDGLLATFTFDASDANQYIYASGNGSYTFNNLAFTQTGATADRTKYFYNDCDININNDLTISNIGGTSSVLLIVDLNENGIGGTPNDMNLGAYCQINTDAVDFGVSVTDNFTGSKSLNTNSTIYYNLDEPQTIADGFTYGNITFYEEDKTARGALDIDGNISRTGATVFYDGGFTHTVAGNWLLNSSNYYTQASATGTIIFDGADQDINGVNFNNISIANSGTASIVNNLIVFGDLSVNAGANIDVSTRNIDLSGDLTILGNGLFTQTTGTTTFNGLDTQIITSNANSYLGRFYIDKPNTTGLQNVNVLSELHVYGNTIIGEDAGVLDISNQDVYFSGYLYVNANTVESDPSFIATGSNVIFDGSDAQYIRNYNIHPFVFNNVQFTGAGDKTLGVQGGGSDIMEVNGNFDISGSTVVATDGGGIDIYVRGDWENTGTFQHNNNHTVFFDGINDQNISSSGFWNVDFGGTNEKILQGNISVYSNLFISSDTLNANNNNISIDGNWDNTSASGFFIPGTGKVTFNGGYAYIYTGTTSGPIDGKGFYNIEINKNSASAYLAGDLDIENDFTLTTGTFITYEYDIWLGGNFTNNGTFYNNNTSSVLTLDATGGTKLLDPNDTYFRGIVVDAPGATYSVQSDFNFRYADMDLNAGTLVLNGNALTVASSSIAININGGTLQVDSASTVEFTGNNDTIYLNSGELILVGSISKPAVLKRNSGRFFVNQIGGTMHAKYYTIQNGNFTVSGGTIDGTNNFSNGTFAGGGGTSYLDLTGLNFSDFTVDNVIFNSGPTYNISRTSGTGAVTFQDASGALAGENYDKDDSDPGTLIEWVFPSGFFWDGGAGTDNWHDANNWSSNTVPTSTDIVYLNHDFLGGAYTIRITSDNAVAQRVIMDDQGGSNLELILENGYDLDVEEHVQIGANSILTQTDNNSVIYVGKNWTNLGTLNHGNSTIYFDGPVGNYIISSGGTGAGKSFYNVIIDATDATYSLGNATNIENDITITNGTFNLASGSYDLKIGGDWYLDQLNGATFSASTADIIFAGADQSIYNGTFYNFIVAGTGTKTVTSNIVVDNDLTIESSATLDGLENTIHVADDWFNNGGTLAQTGLGTILFNGTGGQNIDIGSDVTTFHNISFMNAGGKTFYNNSNVTGSLMINGGSGVVNADTFLITGVGSNNEFNCFDDFELRGENNFPQGFEDISFANTSTVTYQSDTVQHIYPTTYGNLRLRRLDTGNTVKIADGDLEITGSLYLNSDSSTTFDVSNDIYVTLTGSISIVPGSDIDWGTGTSTLEHIGGYWNIDADITDFNNLILNGSDDKYMQGDLIITGDLIVKDNIDLRMYQTTGREDYHTITSDGTGSFTLESAGRVINCTPASVADAIPEGFSSYDLHENSSYYLYSPFGVDQTLYTGNSIQYGSLYFVEDKNVTSDGIADIDVNGELDFNNSTYFDNGKNIKVAGANVILTYYIPSDPSIMLTLDGLVDQYLRDDQEDDLLLGAITLSGSGTKRIGDWNDEITIDGDLLINSGVTTTSYLDIEFNGENWTNNGIFSHLSNRTVTFNGASDQTIDPGEIHSSNYFRNLDFTNTSTKTFINNGADINGNFTLTSGTVDIGSLAYTISGQVTDSTGGTLISSNADITFDGGNQDIITPPFEANNITISNYGTKRLFSDWTIGGDLIINVGTYLNTSDNVIPTYYNINIGGDWTNYGTFVDNTSLVTFNGSASPVNITSGGSDFYDVNFNPGAAVSYYLQSPSTRIARTMTVGSDAELNLNSKELILGSSISSGKTYDVSGSININENAFLKFNNRTSQSVMNVSGSLSIVGSDASNIATITRETTGITGSETQINVLSGGTIAANYYLIEHLQDAGMNLEPGSVLDATNNFSNGTWSNIRDAANVRYLTLESDYTGGDISNITFNFSGTPTEGTHFNVIREIAATPITFDVVGGNLGSYKYEDDDEASASATTGLLKWPPITETNWTGAISSDWHNDGNWDNGIPTATLDAIIPDRANDPIISNGDAECKNLIISNGTLLLDNNRNLTTTGDVSIGTGTSVGILSVNTSNSLLTVGGLWSRGVSGVFLHGNGTVVFNSGAGSTTIDPRTSDFYNVVFDNSLTTFYISGSTINFKGKFEILNGTVTPSTNNYNYNFEGNYTISGGTFTPNQGGVTNGTITLSSSSDQTITNGIFYNLEVSGSGNKTCEGTITINGTTTINSTLEASSGCNIDFNGNMEISSTGKFIDGDETHTFSGQSWTDNGTYSGFGTVIFDRTENNQNLYKGSFYNLIVNCQGVIFYLRDSVTINNDLTIREGINYANLLSNVFTNPDESGTFTLEDNERLYVYGASNFPKGFGLYDLETSSTTYYYGTTDQDVTGVSYGNLYFNEANTKTLKGDVTVKGNLIFNTSTVDVSPNFYTLTIAGTWNNNSTGSFICRNGEVVFNGDANQYIAFGASNVNEFYNLTVNKSAGYANAANNTTNDFIIKNKLKVTNGQFHANGRIIYLSGDLEASGNGTLYSNSGTYYLNKTSGSANITTNNSSILNMTINSSGGATYTALDDIDLVGDFNLVSGTFDGNGNDINLGNGTTDIVTISGNYIVGDGGSLGLGNGTTLTVEPAGSIEVVGSLSTIARVTNNNSGGRYNFIVNGTIAAKYYMFEYMASGGIYLTNTSTIDPANNFSFGTFSRGTSSGQLLRIENTQSFVDPNYIEEVTFPINPGGSASNVTKNITSTGTLEFYNSTGIFAGEDYDNDPADLIMWTGPIELTWNGSVSTDWNDSLNWTASYGPPIVPTGAENVYIAVASNQPILTTYGAITANLEIMAGASITINTPADGGLSDLDVNGDITIKGSLRLMSSDDIMTVEGSWTRATTGAIIMNGNITFDGTGGSKVIDCRGVAFNDLTISGTSQYQLGYATTIKNDLVIESGATFDVSTSNYALTVKGDWINNGTFLSHTGKVTLNSTADPRTITSGGSRFYDVDINAPGITYQLLDDMGLNRNLNIIDGTLDLNNYKLQNGDGSGTDNLTITGTLLVNDNSSVEMGNSARLSVNSGGTLSLVGTDASNRAKVTGQSGGRYSLDVNSGANLLASYYEIEYTDANGLYVHNGATVDSLYNLSEGVFSYGNPGSGSFITLQHEMGYNDTIRNVIFNTGPVYNVTRTSGTSEYHFQDAAGSLGDYEFENDISAPDPSSGLLYWPYKNTYVWTGAIDSDWHNTGNWASNAIPDTSKSALILSTAPNFPEITADTAVAKKVTVKSGAQLTMGRNITIIEDLFYGGSITAVGSPIITVGENWQDDEGSFTPGNSTVKLNTQSDSKDIVLSDGSFYNLEIDASGYTYHQTSELVIENDLIITNGTFDLNGFDINIGGGINNNGTFSIGTQKVTFNGTSGTHSINSGSATFYNVEINSSTGAATYLLSGDMDISNNYTLTKGTFGLSPDGGTNNYTLSIGKRWYNVSGTFNANAGEILVGENWIAAGIAVFNAGTSTVTLNAASGTRTVYPRNNAFYNLTIDGNATFRLSSNLDVDNNLTINTGNLDAATAPSYNIFVGGNWENNSSFEPRAGRVTFDGVNQSITKSTPEVFYNFTFSGDSLTLNNEIDISNIFTLSSGNINTLTNKIVLGTSTSNTGTLDYTAGAITGKFERWLNAIETDYLYPLGTSTTNNSATIRFITSLTAGSLIGEFNTTNPGNSGLPLNDGVTHVEDVFTDGFWRFTAQNSLTPSNYNVSLNGDGFSSHAIVPVTRVLKRTDGGNWGVDGNHSNSSGTECYRNGMSGISTTYTDFCLGVVTCNGGTVGSNATVCEGDDLVPFNSSVSPNGGINYTYTWQYSITMSAVPGDTNWTDITGSNSLTLDYGTITEDTKFVRKAEATGCSTKYSNEITIQAEPVPDSGIIYRTPNE